MNISHFMRGAGTALPGTAYGFFLFAWIKTCAAAHMTRAARTVTLPRSVCSLVAAPHAWQAVAAWCGDEEGRPMWADIEAAVCPRCFGV